MSKERDTEKVVTLLTQDFLDAYGHAQSIMRPRDEREERLLSDVLDWFEGQYLLHICTINGLIEMAKDLTDVDHEILDLLSETVASAAQSPLEDLRAAKEVLRGTDIDRKAGEVMKYWKIADDGGSE